jgi:tetratricopeptide (TPR) repeat protein
MLERLGRETACTTVVVSGFGENDLHALLEGLGIERPSNQLVHLLRGATEGNPLFVREVVRHLVSRGEIARRGGFAVVGAAALQIPPTAATAIATRVAALPERTQRLLALGALVGDRFELALLAGVADEDEDEVVEALDETVGDGLLVDQGQAYVFAHPVIRQTCLGLSSRTRRERLHLRIAARLGETMEKSRRPDLLPHVAHHLVRAGAAAAPPLVCEFARRAADHALASAAWHQAAELLDAVLEAGARGDVLTPRENADVHRWAGHAYHQLSDQGPCFAHLDAAIAGFRATGDTVGLTAALSERARARVVFGKVVYSHLDDVRLLEDALAALDESEWRLRAGALGALAVTYWAAGRFERAEELATMGLTIARAHGDDRLCAELCWDLASAQQQGVRLREALATCEAGLEHARRAGVPASAATCLQRMPLVQFMLGRLDEVEATVRDARELHRVAFSIGDESVALAMLAALEATRGNFASAERWVDEVMRLHERIGYAWGAVLALVTRSHCHAVRGAWNVATAALDEMVRPGRIFEDPSALADTLVPNRLLIDVYAGRPVRLDASPAGFLPAPGDGEGIDAFVVTAYCFQVEVAAAAGRPDLAAPLEGVLARAEEGGVAFTIAWPFLVARIRGLAAALVGRSDEAEAHFERAADLAARCGAYPEQGRALLDHGRLLVARGLQSEGVDRERAATLLRRARLAFGEYDMTGFAAQAEALLAAANHST